MGQHAYQPHTAPPAQPTADDCVTVLIVDDDPAYRYLCVCGLESIKSVRYVTLEAGSAGEALELMKDHAIDCALVDYGLPDMTGAALIGGLRAAFTEWLGPIIVMTSGGSEEVATDVLRAGAADYIPKQQVSPESLHRAIKNALEKAQLRQAMIAQNAQLIEANQQLRKRTDEIARFYQTVSHEIKTPLTAARMLISMLHEGLAGELTETQRDILSQAMDSCDELANQFNELVECTRLEARKIQLSKSEQPLNRLIRRSVLSITPASNAKSIKIEEHCADDLPQIWVDAGRIVQVLANLIGNAVKFTDPGGLVRICANRSSSSPDFVEIAVVDNGVGIDAEHLGHIFERLYQVGTRGDALMGAGLGLGLTIAREIVELHGGSIDVASEIGRGTTFTVRLPIRN